MDVSAGDFEHKGAATSDGLVGLGLRVGVRIVIGSGRVDGASGDQSGAGCQGIG